MQQPDDLFDRDIMRASVERFLELYRQRPIRNNQYGMALNHSWATWYLLDRLRPRVVVESGVWQGHSTWLIERTLPTAQIYSFDVDLSNRKYVSPSASYHEMDLSRFDWSAVDKASTLVFLDDHQNAYQRLILMYWLGFEHVIFEDNHPPGFGDFYTLKHLKTGSGYPPQVELMEQSKARATAKHLIRGVRGRLGALQPVLPNASDWANTRPHLSTYEEMPALQVVGDDYYGRPYDTASTPPQLLFPETDFTDEDLRYNWLTYVELRGQ